MSSTNRYWHDTFDIDFLDQRISRELDNIKETFRNLCDIECLEDGVVFDKDSISVEEITLKKEYNGVRVHVKVGEFWLTL